MNWKPNFSVEEIKSWILANPIKKALKPQNQLLVFLSFVAGVTLTVKVMLPYDVPLRLKRGYIITSLKELIPNVEVRSTRTHTLHEPYTLLIETPLHKCGLDDHRIVFFQKNSRAHVAVKKRSFLYFYENKQFLQQEELSLRLIRFPHKYPSCAYELSASHW